MNSIKKAVFAVTMAVAGFSGAAHSAMIGDGITLTGKLNGTTDSTQSAIIGADVEFSRIADYLDFDFSEGKLHVNFAHTSEKFTFPDNLGSFVFSNFNDTIGSFEMTSNAPKFNHFGTANYSFDAHSVTIDFSGTQSHNRNARLEFSFASAVPSASTPEPGTIALLGLGLLGVVASRRKSGKA